MFDIKEELRKLPKDPGVYLMKDKEDNIIYVGKAVNLKNRVSSYFRKTNKTDRILKMVSQIDHFEYIVVSNEAEALILECNLIKKNRPKYNVLLKDDKTYPYIKIDVKSDYPNVIITRNVVNDGSKSQLITKGAVEEILSISTMIDYQGKVSLITNEIKENMKRITKELNKQGLRVVAVCQKNELDKTTGFGVSDEKNMVLMGFIGFLDPPKESAKSSIEALNRNGIRVIVLTGDNVEVTRCVCDKVGIKYPKIGPGTKMN